MCPSTWKDKNTTEKQIKKFENKRGDLLNDINERKSLTKLWKLFLIDIFSGGKKNNFFKDDTYNCRKQKEDFRGFHFLILK